ncbi:MAG: CoA transferase [Acidimicrobiia bacterium]
MVTALDGVRVLEVGTRLGVASAGLALTALGADVVQVVFADRDVPTAESLYYDRGRLRVEAAADLADLAACADVIVTDLDETPVLHGEQVLVTIRSLGASGPNAHYRMTDLTEWAAGGLAQVTRRPHSDERYVPMLPPGRQPQLLAGLAAATAVIAGRRWARREHRTVVADVSVQEVVAAMLHGIYPNYVWNNIITGHPSTASTALGWLLPASDGDVYIRTLDPRQWDALTAWVDDEAVAALGVDPDSRLANNDAIGLLLTPWSAARRRHEILEEGQRRRIPVALPRSLDDVLAWQHLKARGVWRITDDGATVPRVPMLEPPAWRPVETASAATIAAAWMSR